MPSTDEVNTVQSAIELSRYLAWPVAVLILGLAYRRILGPLLAGRKITVKLPGGAELSLTPKEAEEHLERLLRSFVARYRALTRPEHVDAFRTCLARSGRLTPAELLPGFDHKNGEQIGTLRALRGLGLIVPIEGGEWQAGSHIEVTEFGWALAKHLKDEL